MTVTFKHINCTGLDETEVLRRARSLQVSMTRRFGRGAITLQSAIDSVIDAATEHAQG